MPKSLNKKNSLANQRGCFGISLGMCALAILIDMVYTIVLVHEYTVINMQLNQKKVTKLATVITSLDTIPELVDFLLGIFTPQEIDELDKRLEIVKLLRLGENQRDIAKKLGVGIATVTRGSKELQKGRFKYV